MKLLLVIVNLLVPIWATSLSKTNSDWRIFNGSFAEEHQFKYQISLRKAASNRHTCGGSIIHPNWILTAGHCVYKKRNETSHFSVVVGTNYLENSGDRYHISKIIIHQEFIWIESPLRLQNDVALLKLSTPINMSSNVELIGLERNEIEEKHPAVISGWGRTTINSIVSYLLKYATVETTYCGNYASPSVTTASNICTSPAGMDPGSLWKGDSGGPLVSTETKRQIGIASFTNPYSTNHVDVYVRVSNYIDWIYGTIDNEPTI